MTTFKQRIEAVFNQDETEVSYETRYGPQSYTVSGKDVVMDLMCEGKFEFEYFWGKLYPDETITLKNIDHYGGEDQGTEYWTIWEFSNGVDRVLLKFDGYYQSHYGTEFNEYYEVAQVQVMRTEYQRV